MKKIRTALGFCVLAATLASTLALAQSPPPPDRGELRGLKLGLDARTMTTDGFIEFACGSNGGPPRQKLDDWAGFGKCRAEDNGLHEVYVRFDDEDEYIGRAIDDPLYASQRVGTRVAGHPIILSVLFDDGGILRGLRFVSDPRGDPTARRMAHLLRLAIINRYGPAGWTCTDLPAAPGETAGRRHFSQAALREGDGRAPPDGRGAFPAQARPERHRSGDRRIHVRSVRELDALRADRPEP